MLLKCENQLLMVSITTYILINSKIYIPSPNLSLMIQTLLVTGETK